MNVLLDLIATRVSYVVQEAVVVMKVIRCTKGEAFLKPVLGYLQEVPVTV